MELQEFVREALLNIMQGVKEANNETNRCELSGDYHSRKGFNGVHVEFDVLVVGQDKSGSGEKGGLGIQIASAIIGASKESHQEALSQNANRIKFKVFVKEA